MAAPFFMSDAILSHGPNGIQNQHNAVPLDTAPQAGNQAGVNQPDDRMPVSTDCLSDAYLMVGNQVGVNQPGSETDGIDCTIIQRGDVSFCAAGNQVGVNQPHAQTPTPVGEDDGISEASQRPYACIDAEHLVDTSKEQEVLSKLPKAQAFRLGTSSNNDTVSKARVSKDPQCVARRQSTAAKKLNAEHTRQRVDSLAAALKPADNLTRGSAADRLAALRKRIRERQEAGS